MDDPSRTLSGREISATFSDPLGAEKFSPILEHVGLTPHELAAMKRQGFVSAETRGRTCTVYKLRFRLNGRQQIRYLGTDAALAGAVREELQRVQKGTRAARNLRSLVRESNSLLRHGKSQLLPFAAPMGYTFHGRALRRTRRPDPLKSNSPTN